MPRKATLEEDWQASKSSLNERFKELLHLSKWTDCSFSVGLENSKVEVFKCHKLVLAASSPVFEALFFGGLADSSNKTIDLPDIEPRVFRVFLEYVYSDALNLRSIDEAGGLLYVSNKYLMPKLTDRCVEYLSDHTCLNNLPDVLSIAEAFEIDCLITYCVQLLSRLPCSVWSTLPLSMRPSTVLKLVNQKSLGMSEAELWTILTDWADQECQAQGLPRSPENKANLLRGSGILSKVRFLTFSFEDVLHWGKQVPLNPEEAQSIKLTVQAIAMGLPINPNGLPAYLTMSTEKRQTSKLVEWHCTREVTTNEKLWINRPRYDTAVVSNSRILVVGFEVSTRFVTFSQNALRRVSLDNYDESMLLTIRDKYGNPIAKRLQSQPATFNSYQNISLCRPVWFEPNEKYFICIELPQQQYCLYLYKNVAYGKGAILTFYDDVNSSSRDNVSNGGFVKTVLYNL